MLAALVILVIALLLSASAGLPVGPQHPRHPERRVVRRHHRHRPDHAAGRAASSTCRSARSPGLSAVVAAKLMTAAALPVPVAILGGMLVGAADRSRQRPDRRQAPHSGLHPDARHAVHRPGPDPGGHQWLPGLSAAATRSATIGMTELALRPRLELRVLHRRRRVADFVLRRTVLGRNMYATGGNPEVARLVGINTGRYKIGAFVTVGVLAAIAGMFVMADLGQRHHLDRQRLGAERHRRRRGRRRQPVRRRRHHGGRLVGILLLQVVQSGLVVIGVSSNWQQIAVGVIMVLAVGLDIAAPPLSSSPAPAPSAAEDAEADSSAVRQAQINAGTNARKLERHETMSYSTE